MDDNCKTWFGGRHCNFEPRYDLSEPLMPSGNFNLPRFDPADWCRETYVCDVCTSCGKVSVRPKGAA